MYGKMAEDLDFCSREWADGGSSYRAGEFFLRSELRKRRKKRRNDSRIKIYIV